MNLKDILKPRGKCLGCVFFDSKFDEEGKADYYTCKAGGFNISRGGQEIWHVKDWCDKMVHKDCPLPKIKCENCKHVGYFEDDVMYCSLFLTHTPCIEFEEVK